MVDKRDVCGDNHICELELLILSTCLVLHYNKHKVTAVTKKKQKKMQPCILSKSRIENLVKHENYTQR
jgi:hypothetical protein